MEQAELSGKLLSHPHNCRIQISIHQGTFAGNIAHGYVLQCLIIQLYTPQITMVEIEADDNDVIEPRVLQICPIKTDNEQWMMSVPCIFAPERLLLVSVSSDIFAPAREDLDRSK